MFTQVRIPNLLQEIPPVVLADLIHTRLQKTNCLNKVCSVMLIFNHCFSLLRDGLYKAAQGLESRYQLVFYCRGGIV